ncbi:hypothetical protein FKM82_019439 [Ascaphus truei]
MSICLAGVRPLIFEFTKVVVVGLGGLLDCILNDRGWLPGYFLSTHKHISTKNSMVPKNTTAPTANTDSPMVPNGFRYPTASMAAEAIKRRQVTVQIEHRMIRGGFLPLTYLLTAGKSPGAMEDPGCPLITS